MHGFTGICYAAVPAAAVQLQASGKLYYYHITHKMQQGSSYGRLVSVLLVSALLACYCPPAAGHAALVFPASRNWVAYLQKNFYWSHGLSAGGMS